jgi:nucleoside-diphosphate-sugar epimerase
MSRRILVIGGAGFIGGTIARALERRGDDVVALSRRGGAGVLRGRPRERHGSRTRARGQIVRRDD